MSRRVRPHPLRRRLPGGRIERAIGLKIEEFCDLAVAAIKRIAPELGL